MKRLQHWTLAAAVGVAWFTSHDGHVVAGVAVALLLGAGVARLVAERRWPGPTPLARLSTLTGLGLLGGLVVTGALVAVGEEGWLPGLIGVGIAAHEVHEVVAWALVGWVAVHAAGALRHAGLPRADGAAVVGGLGLGAVLLGAASVAPPTEREPLADDPAWRRACGDCHLAFHPTLLPARSWARMMDDPDHFGEELGLDAATAAAIRTFLVENAAETDATEHAWRVARSVPAGEAPQRITELAWWERVHEGALGPDDRAVRCRDCHVDANTGAFQARPEPGGRDGGSSAP